MCQYYTIWYREFEDVHILIFGRDPKTNLVGITNDVLQESCFVFYKGRDPDSATHILKAPQR